MYIKIKHIKQFLLVVICFFLAGFNYFNYVKADSSSATDKNVCNKSVDSDCDGLTNTEEKLYGTNLNNADTDSDGYSDGVEIKSGYDPLKPAPGDKIDTGKNTSANSVQNSASNANTPTLTDTYLQDLTAYLSTKNGQEISRTELNTFVEEQLANIESESETADVLPDVDLSQVKVLKQNYSTLDETSRKKEKFKDAGIYLDQMIYLLVNNAPVRIASSADFSSFEEDFASHLINFSNDDLEYFSDLGNRLETFLEQARDVQVPETMVELHVKFLRIIKGFLTLEGSSLNSDDPMGKMMLNKKSSAYIRLLSNFFKNDFQSYFNELK